MKSKRKIILILLIGLSLFFIALTHTAFGSALRSSLEKTFSFLQKSTSGKAEDTSATSLLKKENARLLSKLSTLAALQKENSALRDQFQTQFPKSSDLLPAFVIGRLGLLGGKATAIVLDKGQQDGVRVGQGIVVNDVVVGKIIKVSPNLSIMSPLSSENTSIRAKTITGKENGIVKGDLDSSIVLGSVVVSEKLTKGDVVVTAGDSDEKGVGFPPGLVIGKITSIEKKPSALFQTAKLESPINLENRDIVFILKKIL